MGWSYLGDTYWNQAGQEATWHRTLVSMAPPRLEEIKARAAEFAGAFEDYGLPPCDRGRPAPAGNDTHLAAWRRDAPWRGLADACALHASTGQFWCEVGAATGTSGGRRSALWHRRIVAPEATGLT